MLPIAMLAAKIKNAGWLPMGKITFSYRDFTLKKDGFNLDLRQVL